MVFLAIQTMDDILRAQYFLESQEGGSRMNRRSFKSFLLLVLFAGLGTLACDVSTVTSLGLGPSKPQITVQSPLAGAQYREGDNVIVQSTASDRSGIMRVDLSVDGNVVRSDAPPIAQGQTSFAVIQVWRATTGSHTLSVRAYNAAGTASDSALVAITVAALAIITPTSTAVPPLDKAKAATVQVQVLKDTGGTSYGSGSIVREDGIILTCFHVIGDIANGGFYNKDHATTVGLVSLPNGIIVKRYRAAPILWDAKLDLAILYVTAEEDGTSLKAPANFPTVQIGDSDRVKIGDPISIYGFPGIAANDQNSFLLNATAGIVSGFETEGNQPQGRRTWIKTNAVLNPGVSGGMAVDGQEQLIGIPNLIKATVAQPLQQQLSYLLPINLAIPLLQKVPSPGQVTPPAIEVPKKPMEPPLTYERLVARHSNLCLSVGSVVQPDGNFPIVQSPCTGSSNQMWAFKPSDKDGSFSQVIVQGSGKCLTVKDGSTTDGTPIVAAACGQQPYQLWSRPPFGGWYQLVAQHSSKCVDVKNADTTVIADIFQWPCKVSNTYMDNQLFSPINTPPPPPPGVYVLDIDINPTRPHGPDQITFTVKFQNTTGSPKFYRWWVYIYLVGKVKPIGQTSQMDDTVPVGISDHLSLGFWREGQGVPETNYNAEVRWKHLEDGPEHGNETEFRSPTGEGFLKPFTVYP